MYAATLLAILASVALTVGLYFMKRQAERLPSLDGGWRLTAFWTFARDPWWMLGLALQIGGFGLYLTALRNAPLSIVHTALNGGIALFVVLAVVGLGEHVRPVEWCGVGTITVALVVLSISLSNQIAAKSPEHGMLLFSLALVALSAAALVVDQTPTRAIGLSVACGLMLGLGSVYAKALADAPSVGAAVRSVYVLLTLLANLVGFVLMQASFQAGRGVIVMPLSSGLSNLVPIIGGIVIFHEWIPGHGVQVVLRPMAFVLAVIGGALLAGFGERSAPQRPDRPYAKSR